MSDISEKIVGVVFIVLLVAIFAAMGWTIGQGPGHMPTATYKITYWDGTTEILRQYTDCRMRGSTVTCYGYEGGDYKRSFTFSAVAQKLEEYPEERNGE